MLDVAISQVTTPRCELPEDLARLADHGFATLGLWRPKLPDTGAVAAAALLAAAGVRASSLRCAGGFTGSDGRSFAESVADAIEAVEEAAELGRAAPASPPPALVLHGGTRGGHTRTHATRLLHAALEALVPVARREGVVLAIEPQCSAASPGCGLLATLDDALDMVASCGDATVGLALDLWHFGDDPRLLALLPRLALSTAIVRVADRRGVAAAEADRLPVGDGTLPLERIVAALVHCGYRGPCEFDPVGEAVEALGYDGVLRETRLTAGAWARRIDEHVMDDAWLRIDAAHVGGTLRAGHFRRPAAGAGSLRSQASSHTVSPG